MLKEKITRRQMIRGSGATLLAGNLLSFLSCHASPGTSEEGVPPGEPISFPHQSEYVHHIRL